MRRVLLAGLCTSALGAPLWAQTPGAKLGRIRPVEETQARGQMPPMIPPGGTPMIPPGGTPMIPVPATGTPSVPGTTGAGNPGNITPLPPAQPLPGPQVIVEPGGTNGGTPKPVGPASNSNPMNPMSTGGAAPAPGGMFAAPPAGSAPLGVVAQPPSVYPQGTLYSDGTAFPGQAVPTMSPGMVAPQLDAPLYAGAIPGVGPMGLLTASSRWQVSADYLLWWVKSQQVPVLATTSSPQFSGILGRGDTRPIFGGDTLSNNVFGGARFGAVYWLDDQHLWGLDGSLFFLGRNGDEFRTSTAENPLLARPFFNLNQGIPFSEVVAAPGLATGGLAVINNTQMWGADINLRRAFLCGNCSKLDLLMGYKYVRLTDDVTITENFIRTGDSNLGIGVPTVLSGTITDRFATQNNFHGFNLGVAGEMRRGRWTFEGRATVALGTVFQELNVSGSQEILTTNGPARADGGLLALPGANLGTYQRSHFGVVPEVGLKASFDVTQRLRFGVGYTFLYLNDVLRAGEQIDTGLDVTRIPNFPVPGNPAPLTTSRPVPLLRPTDVFAQGLSFSLQYRW